MSHVIIGATGIGRHHARIFSSLGVEISGIVGKTQSSVKKTANLIEQSYGFLPKALSSISDISGDKKVKSVSICSPTELHFSHIDFLLDKKVCIFCEKPLFWNWDLDLSVALKFLDKISKTNNACLVTNNSSAYYVRCLKLPSKISSFSFDFHTRGNNKFKNIAVDLLPHTFSMLYELLGEQEITKYDVFKIGEYHYSCHFKYGSCEVICNFSQNQRVSSFALEIDGQRFERMQDYSSGKYSVYMKSIETSEVFALVDPFESSIQEFVEAAYLTKNRWTVGFQKSIFMQKCLMDTLL